MLHKILVANRGAIAVRIFRTLRKLNIPSVAIYAESDAQSLHVRMADEAICLGDGPVLKTYLNQDRILDIIQQTGVTAVHPGYGFLSENAGFCERLQAAGIHFIGPTPQQMKLFGLKHEARRLAQENDVALLPGTGLLHDLEAAVQAATSIGYPVMLKSTAGGGGIGMQVCRDDEQLRRAWDSIRRLGANNFSNDGIFLEKFIEHARHIEVQLFGDGQGQVLVLGDRDCSCQRRHQKVIEEAPAPNVPDAVRENLQATAQRLLQAVQYRNAGTVEFIYDAQSTAFYFLEVNTRLQVEHGVTEMVYDVDLVEWMVGLATGALPDLGRLGETLVSRGHAVQARIYAENPARQFQPSVGQIQHLQWPSTDAGQLRIDHWLAVGIDISPDYDPMLAKVIAWDTDRSAALQRLRDALDQTQIQGLETNRQYVRHVLDTNEMVTGEPYTRFLDGFDYRPTACEVISAGTLTTVQDYPGRTGLWDVGVPPSGPFDDWSFRLGNRLLGNDEGAAGLEITLNGPVLKFQCPHAIVLCGAPMAATLDGVPIPFYRVLAVDAGQVLSLGKVKSAGARAYMLFAGGIECHAYLGSCSTFTLGGFGGLTGKALRAGDMLPLNPLRQPVSMATWPAPELVPAITSHWQVRVLNGPHGDPGFFTPADITMFYSTRWQVHYNSSRTGIRLIGPKPQWARSDGGEAGLHPSNIHDNAYAVGSIDFTGDMPVILGPDGPSLGGFVCPAVVISADLWKLGQLKSGDTVEFVAVAMTTAVQALARQHQQLAQLRPLPPVAPEADAAAAVIKTLTARENGVQTTYRLAGDSYLLVEYGPQQLDIRLRLRVHALMQGLAARQAESSTLQAGLFELTPGVRSLQVHYDPLTLSLDALMDLLLDVENELSHQNDFQVASRVVHLPLSWDDQACHEAVRKYMQSVRADAPWCPDNIEFIRRINGLDSVDDVKRIVFDASYVVLGLGDVYLGAPLATPMDPRHRLVTTKYNPARTWTAENSVGIGGAYLCIYGMEGPGGYQFVGRTLQMWNRYRRTDAFTRPWLLRFFDQIRFYEVSATELQQIRRDFPWGDYPVRIEETTFSLQDYEKLLSEHQPEIQTFNQRRNRAFQAELTRWQAAGQMNVVVQDDPPPDDGTVAAEGCYRVESPVAGNVWQVHVVAGEKVKAGQVIAILESMKMEIEVTASESGVVNTVLRAAGQAVCAGQSLMEIRSEPADMDTGMALTHSEANI